MCEGLVVHLKMNDNAASTVVLNNMDGTNNGTSLRNTSIMSVSSGNPPYLNKA
jgi:hypothetical protein